MQELALSILDICQNSITAGASRVDINISELTTKKTLLITIKDNGRGMDSETLDKALNPFFSTKKNAKIGLGLALFKQRADLTGGSFSIKSEREKGTVVEAHFNTDSINLVPLGDVSSVFTCLAAQKGVVVTLTQSRDGHGTVFHTDRL